jgi:hypothetical protein
MKIRARFSHAVAAVMISGVLAACGDRDRAGSVPPPTAAPPANTAAPATSAPAPGSNTMPERPAGDSAPSGTAAGGSSDTEPAKSSAGK